MKKLIGKYVACFALSVAIFVAMKVVFMCCHPAAYGALSAGQWLSAIAHGLPMDLAVAGYVTAIPALLLVAQALSPARWIRVAEGVYFAAVSFVLALAAVADTALYGHWGFKLDMTPVFYFLSSPGAVIGGLSAAQAIGAAAGIALAWAAIGAAYWAAVVRQGNEYRPGRARWRHAAVMLVLAAALFVPIRGGFGVSTMNPSKAYFSQNQALNHAAINPAFNVLYSALHPAGAKNAYRFFADAELDAIAPSILDLGPAPQGPDTAIIACARTDIYIIILESFSSHLFPSLGGEPIAVNLDSIAADGLLLTQAYACSFRTDRALPSILSSYAGIPATSVMKRVDMLESLPSLPRILKDHGYGLSYYYGGDINFTNMQAYLVSAGFERIVRDADFPARLRTGKWGVHDDAVFARALADIAARDGADSTPQLTVIQTSSSHEPFEVPYRSEWEAVSPAANAFAYADSVAGAFMRALAASPRWENALVAIVPDHYGAYPPGLDGLRERHRIPIIFTGGALRRRGETIDTPASQADLGATILAMLGIDHSALELSHDIFNAESPHLAYFARPEAAGIVTPQGYAEINTVTGQMQGLEGPDSLQQQLKAMLQLLDKPYHQR